MPTRKPIPATEPVVPPDAAWANIVQSTRDGAIAAEQSLRNAYLTREAYFGREMERIRSACSAELASLDTQIAQQVNIMASCDAALKSLTGEGGSNVVNIAAAA